MLPEGWALDDVDCDWLELDLFGISNKAEFLVGDWVKSLGKIIKVN